MNDDTQKHSEAFLSYVSLYPIISPATTVPSAMFRFFSLIILIGLANAGRAQLIVADVNENTLVRNVLVGNGIDTRNILYQGYNKSLGYINNGVSSGLPINEGILLTSGVVNGVKGPNLEEFFTSGTHNSPGSALLDKYATRQTYDAALLQFEFKPLSDEVVFNYVFASEEYTFYVDQGVSDIFGFFISGPGITGEQNVALVPGTSTPVAVDNINHLRNTQFYLNNPPSNSLTNPLLHEYTQPNGFTVRLTANLKLIPCEWYTIKLAIADVGDRKLDSWVFIEAGSFKHKTLIGNDTFFCAEGFVHTLDAGHPGSRVEWSTGDTTQKIQVTKFGTYWVDVYTKCGKFRDEITIQPAIRDLSLGPDTVFCGDVLSKTLSFPNRKFDAYLWSNGSSADTLLATQAGTYWVEVERYGCKARDTIELISRPFPEFSMGSDTLYCGDVNHLVQLPFVPDSFFWQDGSASLPRTLDNPGTFVLSAHRDGCPFTDTIRLDQVLQHELNLGPDIELCNYDEIVLDTRIRDSVNYIHTWSTGENGRSIMVNKSGTYKVHVLEKRCGFEDEDEVNIRIYEGYASMFLPNAFSPGNADGLNDAFRPVQAFATINHYHLRIYNLWGQMVFESTDPEAAWDGYFQGEKVSEGTYIYSLEIRSNCIPPEEQFRSGTLMLFR